MKTKRTQIKANQKKINHTISTKKTHEQKLKKMNKKTSTQSRAAKKAKAKAMGRAGTVVGGGIRARNVLN